MAVTQEAETRVRNAFPEKDLAGNLTDPETNARIGVAHLSLLKEDYGIKDPGRIFLAHYKGPEKVRKMSDQQVTDSCIVKKLAEFQQ